MRQSEYDLVKEAQREVQKTWEFFCTSLAGDLEELLTDWAAAILKLNRAAEAYLAWYRRDKL